MSRLYDRFVMDPDIHFEKDSYLDQLQKRLQDAEVLVIDNVAEWYWGVREGDGKKYRLRDIPNAAPPFASFFIEWNTPPSKDKVFDTWGIAFSAIERDAVSGPIDTEMWGDDYARARWLVTADAITEFRDPAVRIEPWRRFLEHSRYAMTVAPDGSLIETHVDVPDGQETLWEQQHLAERNGLPLLMPALLAISFLHCKNVTLVGNDPPEKLNRARVKRGKKPLIRYHTLQIEPMRQVLRTEGQIEETGLRKALHICRGHFAHYGDSYGRGKLFGKLEGRYWMPETVKGAAKEGIVVKDYNVKSGR